MDGLGVAASAARMSGGWFRPVALSLLGLLAGWHPVTGWAAEPTISTIAGGGSPASGNGDGGPATAARLELPVAVAADDAGNVYVAERYTSTVRRISAAGIITTVAGNGERDYNGDGIPATAASIDVMGIAVDATGILHIADGTGRIRKVSASGVISTIAVTTAYGAATRVAVSRSGVIYAVGGNRILRVTANGGVQPYAGTGERGFSGDGGQALQAQFEGISSIAVDLQERVYVVDGEQRVRRIDLDGVIRTVAGDGRFRIDPVATSYRWLRPLGVATDSRGNFYVAGATNVVRIVNADGIAADAAGMTVDGGWLVVSGARGFSGDGGPAATALLDEPEAVALDRRDNIYIADTVNGRIRKVTPVPTPRTPAGMDAFGRYSAYGVGSFVSHVAIGDVNGDGRKDALLTTTTWGGDFREPDRDMRLWVFLQKPDGILAAARAHVYAPTEADGRAGAGLAAADLNGDGFDDVVVGTLTGVTVFLGNAQGLATGIPYASNNRNAQVTHSVNIVDLDRDGRPDVLTLSSGRTEGGWAGTDETGLVIHHGNGMGGFARQSFIPRPANVNWAPLRIEDMNDDGLPDLTSSWSDIVDGYYRGGAEITLHNGVAGFRTTTRMMPALDVSWGPGYAVGDFDTDGRKDVIVSYGVNAPDAAYAWFRQLPAGNFVEQAMWKAFDVPQEMLSADMDGDGRHDLLVLHSGWSSIGYHEQTDDGLDVEIKYHIPHSGNAEFPSLAVGDMNGDGCKDVVVADRNHGLIVLPGKNCSPPRRIRASGSQPLAPPGALSLNRVTTQAEGAAVPPGVRGTVSNPRVGVAQGRVSELSSRASVVGGPIRPRIVLFLLGVLGMFAFAGAWSIRLVRR